MLEELRDLRLDMRTDRQEQRQVDEAWREERRRVDEERQRADDAWREERRLADEAWRQERRQADEAWREERRLADEALRQERARSDERFAQVMREFREDSARREAATQQAFGEIQTGFRDIRAVGLSIVKTLNRHTRILEKIERHLGARNDGRPGDGNNRGRPR
jgi:hypothetical protein